MKTQIPGNSIFVGPRATDAYYMLQNTIEGQRCRRTPRSIPCAPRDVSRYSGALASLFSPDEFERFSQWNKANIAEVCERSQKQSATRALIAKEKANARRIKRTDLVLLRILWRRKWLNIDFHSYKCARCSRVHFLEK